MWQKINLHKSATRDDRAQRSPHPDAEVLDTYTSNQQSTPTSSSKSSRFNNAHQNKYDNHDHDNDDGITTPQQQQQQPMSMAKQALWRPRSQVQCTKDFTPNKYSYLADLCFWCTGHQPWQ